MAGILFEDIFDVKDIDPEGKKFDRGEWGPAGSCRDRAPAWACAASGRGCSALRSRGPPVPSLGPVCTHTPACTAPLPPSTCVPFPHRRLAPTSMCILAFQCARLS